MKRTWRLYMDKVNALTVRERTMIYIAAGAVVIFLGNLLFLEPLAQKNRAFSSIIAEQRAEIDKLDRQIADAKRALNEDPDAAAKARIKQVEARIAEIDNSLQGVRQQLVPPERMAGLLEDLLKRNRRLQLVRIQTLPLEGILDDKAADKPDPADALNRAIGESDAPAAPAAPTPAVKPPAGLADQNIFKHGVELTLRGSYLDMLDYLTQIEQLPWRMYWGRLQLDARDPKKPTLVLTLYTLSLDKAWLKL